MNGNYFTGNNRWEDYRIGFVRAGNWKIRFDSGAGYYGEDFEGSETPSVDTIDGIYDLYSCSADFPLALNSLVISSQDD